MAGANLPSRDLTYGEALQRFADQRRNFDHVLAATRAIDKRASTMDAPTAPAYVGAIMLTRALGNAVAIDKVAPKLEDRAGFYDFVSVAVLLRALAESYLVFRYVSVEPASPEDLEFRDALMDYHHCCKHLRLAKQLRAEGVTVEHAVSRKEGARVRLEANAWFQSQPKEARRRQLDGQDFLHRKLEQIAQAAKIHPGVWGAVWAYLSQLAHSAPMSIKLMSVSRATKPDVPQTLAFLMAHSSAFLAKLLMDFAELYPGVLAAATPVQLGVIKSQAQSLERAVPKDVLEGGPGR